MGANNSIAPYDLTLKKSAVKTTSLRTPSIRTLFTDLKICSMVNLWFLTLATLYNITSDDLHYDWCTNFVRQVFTLTLKQKLNFSLGLNLLALFVGYKIVYFEGPMEGVDQFSHKALFGAYKFIEGKFLNCSSKS